MKIYKFDCIKKERFCSLKNTIKRVKKKARSKWENMLLQKSTKNSYPEYLKNTLKSFLKISKQLKQAFYKRTSNRPINV